MQHDVNSRPSATSPAQPPAGLAAPDRPSGRSLLLEGLVVYLVMNYAVIPLSAIGRFPGPWSATTWQVIALHMLGVGPAIVLAARRSTASGRS